MRVHPGTFPTPDFRSGSFSSTFPTTGYCVRSPLPTVGTGPGIQGTPYPIPVVRSQLRVPSTAVVDGASTSRNLRCSTSRGQYLRRAPPIRATSAPIAAAAQLRSRRGEHRMGTTGPGSVSGEEPTTWRPLTQPSCSLYPGRRTCGANYSMRR